MVSQVIYLFDETIEDNLRIAKPDAAREEIKNACRMASVHDFIMTLPDAYETRVGAVVPVRPSFPFLLLAAFSFAKSSERLHNWFIGTKLYKKNIESYVAGKGMTRAAKIRVMITVTILMGSGFTMMFLKSIYIPCIILFCVWVLHIVYFVWGVKTYTPEQ